VPTSGADDAARRRRKSLDLANFSSAARGGDGPMRADETLRTTPATLGSASVEPNRSRDDSQKNTFVHDPIICEWCF